MSDITVKKEEIPILSYLYRFGGWRSLEQISNRVPGPDLMPCLQRLIEVGMVIPDGQRERYMITDAGGKLMKGLEESGIPLPY